MKKLLFILFLLVSFLGVSAADTRMQNNDLIINELMQSNVHCVYADNEFPDSWVELYNASDKAININGYAIGDDEKFSKAYVLPVDVTIAPQSHILIYCDKEEYGLHTDFRVESGKGSLYLFNPQGELIDEVSFAKMPSPDVAYGRAEDASDEWGYMIKTTPAAANIGGVTSEILPQPLFSEVGGLKTTAFTLTIYIPEEDLPQDVQLCITLDGREPQASDVVEAPYMIEIDTTTVVRAKLISQQAVSPLSQTHSYIYYTQSLDNPLPVVSIVTNYDYLYDTEYGILGIPMNDGLNADVEWRRPINIEYFTDGEAIFNQVGETRVQGNWSRRYAQRSLAVYANKRFGVKRFEAQMWKDKPNVTEFKSFTLRNSGNDFAGSHIKDAFSQTLIGRHCDNLDWMAYQPCVCFINGVYKGIYDLRERSNDDYIHANYDGLEDIDMIENWYEEKVGSIEALDELFALVNNPDATYEQLDAILDVEEFSNNFIFNSFITNTDYPFNNHVIWRDLTKENAKWEFIMKDLDRTGYEAFDFDYFKFLYDMYENYRDSFYPHASGIRLYCLVLEEVQLRQLFINRYIAFLGDFLHDDVAMNLLHEMRAEYEGEYYNHCMVYFEDPNNQMGVWNWYYTELENWWSQRHNFMIDYLADYFDLGVVVPVTIRTNGSAVALNDVLLTQETFKGAFYSNYPMNISVDKMEHGCVITKYYKDGTSDKEYIESLQFDMQVDEDIESVAIDVNVPEALKDTYVDDLTVVIKENTIEMQSSQPLVGVFLCDMQGRILSNENILSAFTHKVNVAHQGIYLLQYDMPMAQWQHIRWL